ncbi:patatin-like phospholipase family protein [Dehalogenimonas etheniformans]|uniref:Patatin family protein n=1 Tax=Dehalogenimonas etheniformans TaxID=1536648 RepID=A0A2P5P6L3_9CHLR|nr:patatin-like phospholipase family protein [Dehalogenimonas etheniformans]PPD57946.1 patatin family protein [Dehalogenimonas etheniformans]QNT75297.1 patatin-like phospholipase family protein [Dehalogenimonas etheniformans]
MKIGLALSGGAARGLAHVGVIEVLERENIRIDMVAGASMGAIIGAAYAGGMSAAELRHHALDLSWPKLVRLFEFNPLRTSGFTGTRRVREKLKSIIGDRDFSELQKPFVCVATDIISGEEVVFKRGSVLDAVLASMALPLVFKVPRLGRRYLVDGGISDPLPVAPLKDLGADKIIAVNVLRGLGIIPTSSKSMDEIPKHAPNFVRVATQVIYIASAHLAEAGLKQADVAIEPDMTGIHLADFGMASDAIQRGETAAEASVPSIRKLLSSI